MCFPARIYWHYVLWLDIQKCLTLFYVANISIFFKSAKRFNFFLMKNKYLSNKLNKITDELSVSMRKFYTFYAIFIRWISTAVMLWPGGWEKCCWMNQYMILWWRQAFFFSLNLRNWEILGKFEHSYYSNTIQSVYEKTFFNLNADIGIFHWLNGSEYLQHSWKHTER